MKKIILFNKPFQVLSQFTDTEDRAHLGHHIQEPGYYPAGRLDYDSEGLMLLTNDGKTQHQVAAKGMHKTYVVQVEGRVMASALKRLRQGVRVKDYTARAVEVMPLAKKPGWLWPRNPPIRQRKNSPTSWVSVTIDQGKNRQVRRMMAAVGLPVLRLIRTEMGPYRLGNLLPGMMKWEKIQPQR